MAIPKRHHYSTGEADLEIQVTDDGSRTLVRTDLSDAYHSGCGAISETRHVYLENSGVAERLENGRSTRVLEIGLGTGMAALLTIDKAKYSRTPLHYTAVDLRVPEAATLASLHPEDWVCDPAIARDFLAWRQEQTLEPRDAEEQWRWMPCESIELQIQLCDIAVYDPRHDQPFDAIYFDPFAPATNADLWSTEVFTRMMQSLAPEGKLVTYCVGRQVRDHCEAAGLAVSRVPGPPGGKREVMIASRSSDESREP